MNDTEGELGSRGVDAIKHFERTGNLPDISKVIAALQKVVRLTPNGHANMPGQLNDLGVSFICHFKRTGNVSDISEAISVQQRAIQLTPHR